MRPGRAAFAASLAFLAVSCAPWVPSSGCREQADCAPSEVCTSLGRCEQLASAGELWVAQSTIELLDATSPASDRIDATIRVNTTTPEPPNAALELCATTSTSNQRRLCVVEPFRAGDWSASLRGLDAGTTYQLTASLTFETARRQSATLDVLTRPDRPQIVEASDGISPEYVRLTWLPVRSAAGYRVLRDNAPVAVVNGTELVDFDAALGGLPGPIPWAQASEGTRDDGVEVQWGATSSISGTRHVYQVVAFNSSGDGEVSVAEDGYRAGPPILKYVVQAEGRPPLELGATLRFVDTEAPAGELVVGALQVSHGTLSGAISAELPIVTNAAGDLVTYRVVAANAIGFGPPIQVSGFRSAPAYELFWELELPDGEPGSWTPLDETTETADVELAPGTVRRIRATISRSDSTETTTQEGRGWAGECVDATTCSPEHICLSGFCVPEDYVYVPPHAHRLGSTQLNEPGRADTEAAFVAAYERGRLFGQTEVTQAQWRELMGTSPSFFTQCGDSCPIENITIGSAFAYCNVMSQRDGLEPCYDLSACTGEASVGNLLCLREPATTATSGDVQDCEGWRLPTAFEWEWAARGAMTDWAGAWMPTPYAFSCRTQDVGDHAAYAQSCASPAQRYPGAVCGADRACRGALPVDSLLRNPWGLADMTGNVWEFIWGRETPIPWRDETVVEPLLATYQTGDVGRRGGAWTSAPATARLGEQDWVLPSYRSNDTGFRVVRTVFGR